MSSYFPEWAAKGSIRGAAAILLAVVGGYVAYPLVRCEGAGDGSAVSSGPRK